MDSIRVNDSNKELNELLFDVQHVKLRDRILLSPYTKFLLPSLVIAFVLPVTVYAMMVGQYITESSFSVVTCNLRPEYYVDCLPGKNVTQAECNSVLCCWNDALSLCYHTVPARHGYTPTEGVFYRGTSLVPREIHSPMGSPNVEEVHLDITAVDNNHIKILLSTSSQVSYNEKSIELKSFLYQRSKTKNDHVNVEDEVTQKLLHFLPRDEKRRTVPIELDGSSNLNAYVHYPEFSVTVARDDFTINEQSSVFSTARGPFILTETYWEWTLYFNNGSVYGLNDLELNGTTNWIYSNENGTITPAFLAINPSGNGSAYYVDYKGPLEVQVLNVSNLVILRGMALPDNLAIHVFAGPTPLEAVQQLTAALSSVSTSPSTIRPLLNYGLHVCPSGTLNSVEEAVSKINETMESLASFVAPWDSHCLHERLAPWLNHFLTSDELEIVSTGKNFLEENGRNFSPHLSPMILADEGTLHVTLEENALLLNNGSTAYVGLYQNSSVVYPDWENAETKTIATSYLDAYLNDTGSPESIWLRDTWPKDELNSSSRSEIDFSLFDYLPKELEFAMNNLTLPYNLITSFGKSHHATHNNYSEGFQTLIQSSLPTIKFSGPPGEGVNTSWSGLRRSIYSAVGAGLVGKLPTPTYICGTGTFISKLHDELCIRWYQAAVTWPHVIVLPERLPGSLYLSASASLSIAKALRFRASLATYQHTLVANYFHHKSPVLAPTSFYFPQNNNFTHTWSQFMWGEAILVGLVTLPGIHQVPMKLPGNLSWRHLSGGAEAVPAINGSTPLTATLGQLITLVRPGYIIPVQKEVGNTTVETMLRDITLVVNLDCEDNCLANGEIYFGSNFGEYLSLEINGTHLLLGNLNGSQSYACDNSIGQSTFIKTVELLGNATYEVNLELCDFEENNVAINFL